MENVTQSSSIVNLDCRIIKKKEKSKNTKKSVIPDDPQFNWGVNPSGW